MSTLAVTDTGTLDPTRPFRLSPRIGLRPEPFGALAYHFDTRRLVFLKAPELVELVRALADHPDARSAIAHVIGADAPESRYLRALGSLAEAGVIEPRNHTEPQ